MSRERCENNQQRMLTELEDYLLANGIGVTAPAATAAAEIAKGISLAHSRGDKSFADLCSAGGRLRSPAALDAANIKPLKQDAVEITLGTQDFVFLYAAPFSFPNSCGFLFAPTLEREYSSSGYSTSFDSGGLVKIFQRLDMSEEPREFLMRHELPIPDHREYLLACLGSLFGTPLDYVQGEPPRHAGPIGLIGGDCRRWIHEVRIPHELVVRNPHLQAVFIPRRLALIPEIASLLKWCVAEGFDSIAYDSDRENDFANLRRTCIEYVRSKCLSSSP
jgi:hypothetical protein